MGSKNTKTEKNTNEKVNHDQQIPSDKLTIPMTLPIIDLTIDILADLPYRDVWLQKTLEVLITIKHDSWGPKAPICPPVEPPHTCDKVLWKRKRVIEIAKRYIGLPYKHHHIPEWIGPEGQGIDCSNYTAWAYNYGLGMKFTSHIARQADSEYAPGRKLKPEEKFEHGDLLFIMDKERTRISHVVFWLDDGRILDSRGKGGVQIREFKGWYKSHYAFARRIIE